MNFDDIRQTWQSPVNRLSEAQLEKLKMNLLDELRRKRRDMLGLILITLCPLLFFTAKVVIHLVAPNPDHTPVDLSREWAVLPFFALPWLGWFILVRLQRQHSRRHASYAKSIIFTISALLDENRMERLRHKLVCGLLLVSVPALGIVVHQLRNVGKAGDEILLPALVLYPLYVAGMIAWMHWHHLKKTLPRQRELEDRMREYAEAPNP